MQSCIEIRGSHKKTTVLVVEGKAELDHLGLSDFVQVSGGKGAGFRIQGLGLLYMVPKLGVH